MIDSNVLIDVSRGNLAAIRYLDGLDGVCSVSQVTAMELIVGARNKTEVTAIEELLATFDVIPLNSMIGETAFRLLKLYAKSHGLHVFDSLIAATAMENELTLVTLNRKHYQMIDGLKIQVPTY